MYASKEEHLEKALEEIRGAVRMLLSVAESEEDKISFLEKAISEITREFFKE